MLGCFLVMGRMDFVMARNIRGSPVLMGAELLSETPSLLGLLTSLSLSGGDHGHGLSYNDKILYIECQPHVHARYRCQKFSRSTFLGQHLYAVI